MRTVTLCALLVCLITSVAVAQPFDIRAAASQAPALEHLQRFDFVDQSRIGLMGFSWGAMVGLLVNSRAVAEALSPSGRFASVASFYRPATSRPRAAPWSSCAPTPIARLWS